MYTTNQFIVQFHSTSQQISWNKQNLVTLQFWQWAEVMSYVPQVHVNNELITTRWVITRCKVQVGIIGSQEMLKNKENKKLNRKVWYQGT